MDRNDRPSRSARRGIDLERFFGPGGPLESELLEHDPDDRKWTGVQVTGRGFLAMLVMDAATRREVPS